MYAAVLSVGLVVATDAVLAVDGHALERQELVPLVILGPAAAGCAALGALILAQHPWNLLGLSFVIGGFCTALWALVTAIVDVPHSRDDGLLRWAAWIDNWIFVGLVVLVTWPLLLFPDGRLASPRWRPPAVFLLAATAAIALAGMLDPGELGNADGYRNPLPIPDSWTWVGYLDVFGFAIPIAVVAGAVAVHRRVARRPGGGMGLALWGSRALAVNFALVFVLPGPLYAATLTLSVSLFAVAATVSVLHYRTVELDFVLRRAFLIAGVGAASLTAFLAVFLLVEVALGPKLGAIGGGLAVALLAVPIRTRVGRWIERLLYGHRSPADAVLRMSNELDLAEDPGAALSGLTHAVADALGAPTVSIEPAAGIGLPPGGHGGEPIRPILERALRHRGVNLGRLLVGARAPGEEYGAADLALVEVLVRQITPALDALRLAAELQHSREGIIAAREEERRRIRRELHDGLGSALAGIALTLDAARNSAGGDVDELLGGARDQTNAAVADVRRIVRDLRAPALDDLGLVEALFAYAQSLSPMRVEFDVDPDLNGLPAAVETALYRITCESLTNAVRHAHASHCHVSLHTEESHVALEVEDDGAGLVPFSEPGVGLRSMRERASELGGSFTLGTGGGGGVLIRVVLPIHAGPP